MNIFAINEDVVVCAQALDDKRLNKMLTETCQTLCTVRNSMGYITPYKSTHVNHPVVKWAASNFQHRCWLGHLGCAYYTEFRLRFAGSAHSAWDKCQSILLNYSDRYIALTDLKFVNCARHTGLGIDFTTEPNVHLAYKKYLRERWKLAIREKNPRTIPTFTNRNPPDFARDLKPYMHIK